MSDNQIIPPPSPPTPVLAYEITTVPAARWMARLICWLAIANGACSAGYVAASRIPGAMANLMHAWSDVPVAVCGLLLTAFGLLGFSA